MRMSHPKLEVSSWFSTQRNTAAVHKNTAAVQKSTVVAIIGIVVALGISFNQDSTNKITERQPSESLLESPSNSTIDITVEENDAGDVVGKSSISESLVAAKQIRRVSAHDQELSRLARLATERGEYAAAIEAASEIRSHAARDAVLVDYIHCYALHAGDKTSVDRAIEMSVRHSAEASMLLRTSRVSAEQADVPNHKDCKAF